MVSKDDLEAVTKSLAKSTKPKISVTSSLDSAIRRTNFGAPKINIDQTDYLRSEKNPTLRKWSNQPIKIKVTSPTIKTRVSKAPQVEKKLVLEADIEKIVSHGEFSADAISFIPYGAGFLTAREALEKFSQNPQEFKVLQEAYLSDQSLQFIISRLDKIFDLNNSDKEKLHNFYSGMLFFRSKIAKEKEEAKKNLAKIKLADFRTKLGQEVSRMIPRSGNLYNYYANFDLIDNLSRKSFLAKISQIDTYILKKIKELVTFNQIDLYYRYDEVLYFSKILEARNILMSNFHSQVEHLLSQKKSADEIKEKCQNLISSIKQIAADFGKRGKYGAQIARSGSIINKIKTAYFIKLQQFIDPPLTRLQKTAFDLELGNYIDLETVKTRISDIDATEILHEAREIYDKFSKETIK